MINEQFSGFALTAAVLCITIQGHRANRLEQRRAIREQVERINWLASSSGAYDRRFAPSDASRHHDTRRSEHEDQKPMKEILKHRWNQEVEGLARMINNTHWEDVQNTAADGWKAVIDSVRK